MLIPSVENGVLMTTDVEAAFLKGEAKTFTAVCTVGYLVMVRVSQTMHLEASC